MTNMNKCELSMEEMNSVNGGMSKLTLNPDVLIPEKPDADMIRASAGKSIDLSQSKDISKLVRQQGGLVRA